MFDILTFLVVFLLVLLLSCCFCCCCCCCIWNRTRLHRVFRFTTFLLKEKGSLLLHYIGDKRYLDFSVSSLFTFKWEYDSLDFRFSKHSFICYAERLPLRDNRRAVLATIEIALVALPMSKIALQSRGAVPA